jgi:hypothetical protein
VAPLPERYEQGHSGPAARAEEANFMVESSWKTVGWGNCLHEPSGNDLDTPHGRIRIFRILSLAHVIPGLIPFGYRLSWQVPDRFCPLPRSGCDR